MHGNRIGRHRPTRIDEQSAALVIHMPFPILALDDILPADLADIIGAIAACFKIDDAYPGS